MKFGLGWTLDLRSVQLRKHRSLSRDWQQVYQGGWYVLEPVRPREISIVFRDERAARFVAALSPDVQFG